MPTMPPRSKRQGATLPPPEAVLRRVPRQERGHERVDRLLDAAAEVIAEIGVDAMTTNAIAARAQTSVGSLYQFFPNKDAIVTALAARYNAQLREVNDQTMLMAPTDIPVDALIDRIIAPFAKFFEDNPAYRHVYHAMHNPSGPSCEEAELHRLIVSRVEMVLAMRNAHISLEERHLQATVVVLATHALLSYAMTASPGTRDGLIAALKHLVTVYVSDVTKSGA